MAATEVDLADAVKAELNDAARSWTGQFTAVRLWLPTWTDEELATLRVAVIPLTIDRRGLSRAKDLFDYGVAIDMQKLVTPSDTAAIDALSLLAETVHDFYRLAHRLATMTAWHTLSAAREDVYDLEALSEHGLWETLIVLTLQGQR